jgi:DNA polymerase III subunit alpha
MAFAHLHVHSQFSVLNGVPSPKKLAASAAKAGMSSIALTDGANLYGAVEWMKACKEQSLHGVIGAELWVDPRGLTTREGGLGPAFNVVLLVENEVGYRNLCALLTTAIFEGIYHRPRVDWQLLRSHAAGLLCLSGNGETGAIRGSGNEARVGVLGELFGAGRFFGELMDHGLPGQAESNGEVRRLAAMHGFGTVVTNDVRYLAPTDVVRLDLLNSIANGASLADAGRPRQQTDQQYLKTEAELRELFPGDDAAISLTEAIAQRCDYHFPGGIYYFPASVPPDREDDTQRNWEFFLAAFPPSKEFPVPAASPPGGGTLNGYFGWYGRAGLDLRLRYVPEADHPPYWERLESELTMIVKMGFPAYLLIVAEFINWAKDRGIPVGPGRGSAAGSVIAWSMRITDIDPVRFALLFERFLNPERVSMPDIDVDFAQDRREEVIEHVREKYGSPLVSQIITYGKLQAKAALKDVARVCDISFQESDRITKLVPERLNITLSDAVKEEPRLQALMDSDPKVRRVVTLALAVEGSVRQTGVHAAGVVIADRPIVELAPLYRDGSDGGPVVQYDMKSAESIGLIKFDFLGLKTLDQVRDAVAMIERNTGQRVDIDRLPEDDAPTWTLLIKGDALGVFQVESDGMRALLTRLRPNCLDDLVALVALYRPGPLSSGMVDDFIDRKHGRKAVEYPFPELEPILSNTYGTIVYQEQVMQCAQVLAGYRLGEADMLRRAMGKKDAAEMQRQKVRFVDGAVSAGHDQQKASDLFDLLAKFAEYGFNKSHSAAYGFISFQTAWLKANHRAEYMAALMSIDAGNSDKVLLYTGDCRRNGIEMLPPDINASVARFDVPAENRRCIRFGLQAVKGVGEGAVEAIVEVRGAGPFTDFMDLLRRVDARRVNKKVWESLIKCGALDGFGLPRSRLIAALEDAMSAASDEQAQKAAGQVSLFGGGMVAAPAFRMPNTPAWTVGERMKMEKEALGFFLTGHPVTAFRDEIEAFGYRCIADLATVEVDAGFSREPRAGGRSAPREHSVCAIITGKRVIRNKKGDPMAFVTFEDPTGSIDAVLFKDTLAKFQPLLDAQKPLAIRARVEQQPDKPRSLRLEGLEPMDDVRERMIRKVELVVRADELSAAAIAQIKELFEANPGPCPARFLVEEAGRFVAQVSVARTLHVKATPRFVDGVRSLFGRAEALRLTT